MQLPFDLIQFIALLALLFLAAKPFGTFMARVYAGEKTLLSGLLGPFEKMLYRLCGIDAGEEMDWRQYAIAMILFSGVGFLALFLLLLLQGVLPGNPQKVAGFPVALALGTAVSFMTNTNWQAYSGETMASYLTQMAGLTVHNFVSAATGMAVAITLIRGFVRKNTTFLGNFWVDLTRGVLYVLLPLSLIAALFLVSEGVIQNWQPYRTVPLVQPYIPENGAAVSTQTIPMGPVASQEAIKELGTNGGGFFNANSAHPFENPTPLTNFFECLLILLIPTGLTFTFGRMTGNPKQGRTLCGAMLLLFVIAVGCLYWAELSGNPLVTRMGVAGPYLEGKEVRFGLGGSVLFTAITTATSCGAVNTMHDSLTPLGGMIPMIQILLGEVVFGGVGSGLYTMLAFVIIAVFVAGLMIGRTPEYLGKKIGVIEMWMAVITVLIAGVTVLVSVAVALVVPAGLAGMSNPGAHGLSEVLYAFASTANNNGSAFAGLMANTPFYNLMTALAMIIGRFGPALAMLALAGAIAAKKIVPPSLGTLGTDTVTFIFWLSLVIVIVGALTFFPALALGPIAEHLIMTGGN